MLPTPQLTLSRQPIFNSKYIPLGHEILLKDRVTGATQSTTSLFDTLQDQGADELLCRGVTFLRCKADEAVPAFEDLIDPKRIALELEAPARDAAATFTEKIDALQARGFQISVGEYALQSDFRTLLGKVQFLKINTRKVPPALLKVLPQKLAAMRSLRLIAANIPSSEIHNEMVTARYHCFQGGLKCVGLASTSKTLDASRKNILIVMKMAQEEANFSDIEQVLKGDPGLTFSLLQHVNSPAFGQRSPTTSLNRATQLVGHQKLYRWLGIRLMATSSHPAQNLLLCSALTRGRFMELLAPACMPRVSADDAFVVGVFSLLDKLLGVSIEEALAEVRLPENVMEAFNYWGALGSLLYSAKACELPDKEEELMAQEDELGIKGQILATHLQAAHWAETIIQG